MLTLSLLIGTDDNCCVVGEYYETCRAIFAHGDKVYKHVGIAIAQLSH